MVLCYSLDFDLRYEVDISPGKQVTVICGTMPVMNIHQVFYNE